MDIYELGDEKIVKPEPISTKKIAYVRRELRDEARVWARRMYKRALEAENRNELYDWMNKINGKALRNSHNNYVAMKQRAEAAEAERDELQKHVYPDGQDYLIDYKIIAREFEKQSIELSKRVQELETDLLNYKTSAELHAKWYREQKMRANKAEQQARDLIGFLKDSYGFSDVTCSECGRVLAVSKGDDSCPVCGKP